MNWLVALLCCIVIAVQVVRVWRSRPVNEHPTDDATPQRFLTSDLPRVSFLVPAWNSELHIAEFVDHYRRLRYPNKELILCAGGSDESWRIARSLAANDVVVLQQMVGDGKQGALRKSMAEVAGDIVYFTDVDCRPTDEVVENLLHCVIEAEHLVVTGPSRPLASQLDLGLVKTHWAIELASLQTIPVFVTGILGRNAAIATDVLKVTNALDVDAPSGTDYTLAKEVISKGYRIRFVPGRPMPSEYPESIRTYARKQARWLRNVMVIGSRYRAWRDVVPVSVTLMIPFVLFGVLGLALLEPVALAIVLVLLFLLTTNRLIYQVRAGLGLDIAGAWAVVVGDQLAALLALVQIGKGEMTW